MTRPAGGVRPGRQRRAEGQLPLRLAASSCRTRTRRTSWKPRAASGPRGRIEDTGSISNMLGIRTDWDRCSEAAEHGARGLGGRLRAAGGAADTRRAGPPARHLGEASPRARGGITRAHDLRPHAPPRAPATIPPPRPVHAQPVHARGAAEGPLVAGGRRHGGRREGGRHPGVGHRHLRQLRVHLQAGVPRDRPSRHRPAAHGAFRPARPSGGSTSSSTAGHGGFRHAWCRRSARTSTRWRPHSSPRRRPCARAARAEKRDFMESCFRRAMESTEAWIARLRARTDLRSRIPRTAPCGQS